MGGAERPGQIGRLGQPVFQQFKDGLPGNNRVLGGGSGERRGNGQQFNRGVIPSSLDLGLPGIPVRGSLEQGRRLSATERTGIPIDIEARLAEMDSMWGIPIEIGKTIHKAANIMDDRLNLLHQEVLAVGDQASIHTMNIVNFTFKYYYFNFLPQEKRVALYEALKAWYEKGARPEKYFTTAREKKIVSECSERMGNGAYYVYEHFPIDDYNHTPTLEDLWDYDFPDPKS